MEFKMANSPVAHIKLLMDAFEMFVTKCDKGEIKGIEKDFLKHCKKSFINASKIFPQIQARAWQPMKIAPKDGQDILAINKADLHAIISWNGEYWVHPVVEAIIEVPPEGAEQEISIAAKKARRDMEEFFPIAWTDLLSPP